MREPIEYFYRNLGIHYLPPPRPMRVTLTYRNLNALDEARAQELARARVRTRSLVHARRADLEQCRATARIASHRLTTLSLVLMADGRVVLDTADNAVEIECLSAALGLPSVPGPWHHTAEPFTVSARLRFRPPSRRRERDPYD
jgi:hypothetical protein